MSDGRVEDWTPSAGWHHGARRPPIRSAIWSSSCNGIRPWTCPSWASSGAAPWATSATTSCGASSGCPTRRRATLDGPRRAVRVHQRARGRRQPALPGALRGVGAGAERVHRLRSLRALYDRAEADIADAMRPPARPRCPAAAGTRRIARRPPWAVRTTRRPSICATCERIKEYIVAGDAFQVLLARRIVIPHDFSSALLYRALRVVNPSPYMYHLELDGVELVGSSPELLVRVAEGRVTVRPIAGTRPRGAHGGGGRGAHRRAAGRREGARRAPDAGGPGPQRRGPHRAVRECARHRTDGRGALLARAPHREPGGGDDAAGAVGAWTPFAPPFPPAR